MECQECHKRPATLHFTQVVNGDKTEVYVCEVCAKEKGYMTYPEEGYSLHHLLSGLFSPSFEIQQDTPRQETEELQCPKCEMTLSKFKQVGKFGCSQCYQTLKSTLTRFSAVCTAAIQHTTGRFLPAKAEICVSKTG